MRCFILIGYDSRRKRSIDKSCIVLKYVTLHAMGYRFASKKWKKKKTFLLIEKCSIFYLITPACSTAAHLETLEIQILHTCHCHDLQY